MRFIPVDNSVHSLWISKYKTSVHNLFTVSSHSIDSLFTIAHDQEKIISPFSELKQTRELICRCVLWGWNSHFNFVLGPQPKPSAHTLMEDKEVEFWALFGRAAAISMLERIKWLKSQELQKRLKL